MTIIKNERPPNFSAIAAKFPLAYGQGVIFAYAPYIYSPHTLVLPVSLIAHENVHIERQKAIGVELWWQRYIDDVEFRFEEELLAHRAEYISLKELAPSRQGRRAALKIVGAKLSQPLYGRMVTAAKAMQMIGAE